MASSSSWQPAQEGVQQVGQLLQEYIQPNANQQLMYQRLQECSKFPDFNSYLALILCKGDGTYGDDVRQTAGLLLKNNLKTTWQFSEEPHESFIRDALTGSMTHPSRIVRRVVGTSLAICVRQKGWQSAPQLWQLIAENLDASKDPNALDGALDALYKICEETNGYLESDVATANQVGLPECPASLVIPKTLQLFGHPDGKVRQSAIAILNMIAPSWPREKRDVLDDYLRGLFALAHDPDDVARKYVCQGLVQLLHIAPEKMTPNLREIITFMLERQTDPDPDVAVESCEFWAAFVEADLEPESVNILREFTPHLIPVLLTNMAYEEDDEEVLQAEEDELNADRPDRDQDIKPTFRAQKDKSFGEGGKDGDEEYDDDDDDDWGTWNLRKSSASGLDTLSLHFGDELLQIMLPVVEQRLADQNWRIRESAILALGAVAEGCTNGLAQYLPQLVGFLYPMLDDARPLVRSTTCWTLSRFSPWLCRSAMPADHPNAVPGTTAEASAAGLQQLQTVLMGILNKIVDKNKKVQAGACGALANSLQEGRELLAPWTEQIVQALSAALERYQRKNQRNLYDALQTMAEYIGPSISDPKYADQLLPRMLEKWKNAQEGDPETYHLLECITAVVAGTGSGCMKYAPDIFAAALQLCTTELQKKEAVRRNELPHDAHIHEHLLVGLDLLSGLAEGLGQQCESLLMNSHTREILLATCADDTPSIRRSAFALLGDVSKACPQHVSPSLREFLDLAKQNLAPDMITAATVSCCNNACWAAGELAIRCEPSALQPHARAFAESLAGILEMRMVNRSLGENAAITLGRISMQCAEELASALQNIAPTWCVAMRRLRDGVEKEHAFKGLCELIKVNPNGGVNCLKEICEAIASWRQCRSQEVSSAMRDVLQGYKNHIGAEQWAQLERNHLEPAVAQKLKQTYGV
tara:strand:- start:371 stop:3157 length:2787 start_codon:yes stop_codon:yes gene_type:complete